MSAGAVLASRVTAEIGMLMSSPPPGVSCWPVGDSIVEFEAVIIGAEDTPYDKGEFKVHITLPTRYPMEPPRCVFKTRVYHPNIDEGGRICLDILNLPPKGSWKPSLNISTVLISLRLLLGSPNPDDPLVGHISDQFVADHDSFVKMARDYTQKYAMPNSGESKVTTTPQTAPEEIPEKTSSSSPVPHESVEPANVAQSDAPRPRDTEELDKDFAPSPKKSKIEENVREQTPSAPVAQPEEGPKIAPKKTPLSLGKRK